MKIELSKEVVSLKVFPRKNIKIRLFIDQNEKHSEM